MTTAAPNTTRALDQLARLRAAGWAPPISIGDRPTMHRVDHLLAHLEALDLDVPATLADGLTQHADRLERLDALTSRTPAPFGLDDLDAEDAPARFDTAIAAQLAAERAHRAAAHVRDQLNAAILATIRPAVDPVFDTLAALHLDRAAEFHAPDAPGLTGAERDERQHLHKHLTGAARWVWSVRPGTEKDYDQAHWVQWFEWTPGAYRALVDATRPGFRLVGGIDHYTVATACGATPRMAASYADAEAHALALTRRN